MAFRLQPAADIDVAKVQTAAVAVISECNFSWPSLTEFGAPFGVAAL
jgi:hypothetical protein